MTWTQYRNILMEEENEIRERKQTLLNVFKIPFSQSIYIFTIKNTNLWFPPLCSHSFFSNNLLQKNCQTHSKVEIFFSVNNSICPPSRFYHQHFTLYLLDHISSHLSSHSYILLIFNAFKLQTMVYFTFFSIFL